MSAMFLGPAIGPIAASAAAAAVPVPNEANSNAMEVALEAPAPALAASYLATNDTPDKGPNWTFAFNPYAWIANVGGTIDTSGTRVDLDVSSSDLLDIFEVGGLLAAELFHKSGWGLKVDYIFADLGFGGRFLGGTTDFNVGADILDVTAGRKFDFDHGTLLVYAGIRSWNTRLGVNVDTFLFDTQLDLEDNWIDPLVGLRYSHQIAPGWRVVGQGDIGGFGAGSEFSWQIGLGVVYDASKHWSFQLYYRRLDLKRDSPPPFADSASVEVDITVQGPLIGVGYRF